ncbi:MAG: DUF6514 family protein [bacterium]|nr:DUF6514 family protein [bacterium]
MKNSKRQNYCYSLVKNYVETEEKGIVTVYGINISNEEESVTIHDVTVNKNKIEALLSKLCRLKVQPKYLEEIIEDFLCDLYGGCY